ncbi:EamA family transporter [Gordonia sp. ABSL1-1]|uniref:DMT family transporter n=1 Tax=Gordonia sp. ABSL1-1 TaxID=3053923 RepID=UPI00257385E8|nr:EamA family transporter [Gordonia sp. ABSL1-1]MDL9935976.1 EamA family transporter [Gordonia sp. ABSL1-1]
MGCDRQAMLSVLAAAVLWGTTGTAAAYADSLSALTIGAVAMGVGGVMQTLVNGGALRRQTQRLRPHLGLVIFGAACVALYPLAFYSSMRVGGVAVGTIVSLASAPVASAVIERIVDKRALEARWMRACLIGLIGASLLCVTPSPGGSSAAMSAGVALGLAAGVTYAGYSWVLKTLMRKDLSRGAATGAVLGLGGALLLPVVVGSIADITAAPSSWWVLAYLAIVPMFGGYVLFSHGLGGVDASTATTLTLAEPAVATVLSVAVLGEHVSPWGWTGIGMLAVSMAVLLTGRPAATAGRRPTRRMSTRAR